MITDAEKKKLNFNELKPEYTKKCIYGQITGSCESDRAKELMDECCIRVMNFKHKELFPMFYQINNEVELTFKGIKSYINGENKGQGWDQYGYRRYNHLSVLEAYIGLIGSNNEGLIQYIKGEN